MEEIKVLDHGFVKLIEAWGSDQRIIESARMSTDKGFLGWGPTEEKCAKCNGVGALDDFHTRCTECRGTGKKPGDEKLLRYLYENGHGTPFEMAGLTIEVKAPIMVFREWHRHRVPFGYNEMSARYVPLPDENYLPTVERMLVNSKTNKQAGTIKGAAELTAEVAVALLIEEREFNAAAERLYQKKLQAGVPKELARSHLGVSRYSKMRATANLRGWLGFLRLRMASVAQWEIRQYANATGGIIAHLFPRTWDLFVEGRGG